MTEKRILEKRILELETIVEKLISAGNYLAESLEIADGNNYAQCLAVWDELVNEWATKFDKKEDK